MIEFHINSYGIRTGAFDDGTTVGWGGVQLKKVKYRMLCSYSPPPNVTFVCVLRSSSLRGRAENIFSASIPVHIRHSISQFAFFLNIRSRYCSIFIS